MADRYAPEVQHYDVVTAIAEILHDEQRTFHPGVNFQACTNRHCLGAVGALAVKVVVMLDKNGWIE